ncbi:hypothetical protein [Pelomonas sp. SE-A7]|uniref:hypothetical protein n=1 Tax=Pelomonas sp. SE-A7 TaxID=3054953 RepID=UPI00259CE3E5|nr:hypothetical protein [Pelomonas sp. SE-A7]MDM4768547.1 hypothetical protein [Pelomonas sp. SE-A7]
MLEAQRRAQIEEVSRSNFEREYICPNCGGPSSFMGIDFKAPKASDVKGWQKVEQFIRSGKVYYRGVS